MTGRAGCSMCDGLGFVERRRPEPPYTHVRDDGSIIGPCPLCLSKDKVMYGDVYMHHGVRLDPRAVKVQGAA